MGVYQVSYKVMELRKLGANAIGIVISRASHCSVACAGWYA